MIKKRELLEFKGDIHEPEDISAIASFDKFLVIGSDESKNKIQVLKQSDRDKNKYELFKDIELLVTETIQVREVLHQSDKDSELPGLKAPPKKDTEFDVEGLAYQDNTLFVIGSHALKREKFKADKSYQKNRERLTQIEEQDKRNNIFRLTIDPESATVSAIDTVNIIEIVRQDKLLGIFTEIPSKENGVDIEGIAVDGEQLYLGFRGPVLRENYVPVMIATFEKPNKYEIRFVVLGGNGIRDIAKVSQGFLILSGPVGDGFGPYQLFFWNGVDLIPGKDKPQEAQLALLGEIPSPNEEAKAEGITVLEETDTDYKLIVVYDSALNGAPTLFQVTKLALKN